VRDVAKTAIELMENNIFGERFIIVAENNRYADLAKQIRSDWDLKMQKFFQDLN
jgi:nucleoside-diphosphate-sugar epimerase